MTFTRTAIPADHDLATAAYSAPGGWLITKYRSKFRAYRNGQYMTEAHTLKLCKLYCEKINNV